jgi:hypothetical protein
MAVLAPITSKIDGTGTEVQKFNSVAAMVDMEL